MHQGITPNALVVRHRQTASHSSRGRFGFFRRIALCKTQPAGGGDTRGWRNLRVARRPGRSCFFFFPWPRPGAPRAK